MINKIKKILIKRKYKKNTKLIAEKCDAQMVNHVVKIENKNKEKSKIKRIFEIIKEPKKQPKILSPYEQFKLLRKINRSKNPQKILDELMAKLKGDR